MVSIFIRSALLAATWFVPSLVLATDAAPLTLTAAVQRAVTQSRLLESASWQTRAAREMAVAADQLPDPVLKFGVNNLPINGEDRFSLTRDFMTMRSIGVMQELTREDKRRARATRSGKEAEIAETKQTLIQSQVQQQSAVAWLERYYQEQSLALLMRQRDEARLQIEAADAAYRGGRGAQSEVFSARSMLAQMDDRIAMAQRLLASAKVQLERWIGAVAEQVLADLPPLDTPRLNKTNLEAELLHHPQIVVMLKQEERALADAELARANQKSDWSLELMASQRGSAYSDMLSVNVSVPLQWDPKNRQDRELAAKLATVAQLGAEREDAVRAHAAEVRAMLQEWQSNQARLKHYDETLLPLTTERTRAALAVYRGASSTGASLGAVLESRRAELDAGLERLRLAMETARVWAQLNYLTPHSLDAALSKPKQGK